MENRILFGPGPAGSQAHDSETKTLFLEDVVVLKSNPWMTGIVERTWHDIDGPPIRVEPGEAIFDTSTSEATRRHFFRSGLPPRDHVIVLFGDLSMGIQLRPESHLSLLDRSLSFGDVVKRSAADQVTGTVIRTRVICDLRPSCIMSPQSAANRPADWQNRQDMKQIPAEELSLTGDFHEGDFVIYKSWVGVVIDFEEEVTMRLSDRGVVVLEDSLEVEVSLDQSTPDDSPSLDGEDGSRAQNGRTRGQRAHAPGNMPVRVRNTKSIAVDRVSVGQHIVTKKWNLRRGQWKYGSYNPNTPPQGFVVEVRPVFVWVRWLCSNVMTPFEKDTRATSPRPEEKLEASEFESSDFHRYSRGRMPRCADPDANQKAPLGSSHGSDLQAGDYIRFRDLAGAMVKYDGTTRTQKGESQGTLVKIDRRETEGYDINTFLVTETTTKVSVLWQDLSETSEISTSLIPYLNIDEHDLWPGEIVTAKLEDDDEVKHNAGQERHVRALPSVRDLMPGHWPATNETAEPESNPKPWEIRSDSKLGVAQSVDAAQRVASVRWFANPKFEVTSESPPILLPGSNFGPLEDHAEERSLYEMIAQPGLTKRRGDFVIFASHSQKASDSDDIDWFGEIVDLGLDGLITVRLGAATDCRDVQLPLERVTVVYGDDDEDDDFGTDEGYDGEDSEHNMSSDHDEYHSFHDDPTRETEETVEYEGGERAASDGGEEMWTTDDDDPSPSEDHKADSSMKDFPTSPEHHTKTLPASARQHAEGDGPPVSRPDSFPGGDSAESPSPMARPTRYQNFVILESPPPSDHAFYDQLSATTDLRRLHKEYAILKKGLPEDGIWVQTWDARLDLMRVLILGPRDTPYSLAPFVMDFQFGDKFPAEPPSAYFHSWTNGYGRINPNLYEDGKICLSLLGTWPADAKNEGWSSKSTVLQVLVSLMGLVLVKEPYYNEAGFDVLVNTPETAVASSHYTERAYTLGRGFVRHALTHPVLGMEDLLRWLYLPSLQRPEKQGLGLLKEVVERSQGVLANSERRAGEAARDPGKDRMDTGGSGELSSVSVGAAQLLKKHVKALEGLLVNDEACSSKDGGAGA